MASGTLPDRERPIGLIGNDPGCAAVAQRLGATGHRVLHLMLAPAEKLPRGNYLEAAATVADIAIDCDVILLAIEDTAMLRTVLLGDADRPGLAADLMPGSVLIDLGMRPPREVQSVLGLVGMRGVAVVDAALVGANAAVLGGTANVLVGGFPDAVERVLPILGELGRIERTGPLGSAQTAAALMGYVEAAHFEARSEAITVGAALGLKAHTLSQLFHEAPDPSNVIRFEKQAKLARRLSTEGSTTGTVLSFRRLGPAEAT